MVVKFMSVVKVQSMTIWVSTHTVSANSALFNIRLLPSHPQRLTCTHTACAHTHWCTNTNSIRKVTSLCFLMCDFVSQLFCLQLHPLQLLLVLGATFRHVESELR